LSAPPHALPLTVAQLYRRLTAALREPPRLVAIGLKPSIAETAQAGAARAPEAIAWRTEVSIAHAARPLQ
jgi:hypothetical protein